MESNRQVANKPFLILSDLDHIVVYFHQFGQKSNVPIDAYSNILFIHILASVVGIKDMLHELISNIDKGYHVVEYGSFSSNRTAIVKDGALDHIFPGVLILCQLADHFHAKLSRVLYRHAF